MSEGKWKETVGNGFGTGRRAGTTKKVPVTDERDGAVGGYHIEHWDGSQDAVINARPVNVKTGVPSKEGTSA